METEEQEMLERVLKLSEQNNRILRGMRREATWSRIFHILYWVLIIGVSVASYYYIKPYLGQLNDALESIGRLRNFTGQ